MRPGKAKLHNLVQSTQKSRRKVQYKNINFEQGGYWYEMEAYLPTDLECDHCVLQWRYHCANSWGSDETGSGLGKGYQEEFYGCADISVKNKNVKPTQAPTTKDQLT